MVSEIFGQVVDSEVVNEMFQTADVRHCILSIVLLQDLGRTEI